MQGRRGHICVGATGTNPLRTGEAESPRPADTGMPVSLAGREPGNGLWLQLPSQGPFLDMNNCQGLHCRRFFLNKFH